MDLLERFLKMKHAPKQGVVKPPPEKGAARFFFLLTTHLSKLIRLNALFLLFCLPVVTIPAAVSAMNRVSMLLVRDGVCFVWTDFIAEFKSDFLKSVTVFLFNAVFFAFAAFCFFAGQRSGAQPQRFILYAASVVLYILGVLLGSYSFSMLALCQLSAGDILRNAFSLIFLEPKTDLLLVVFVGGVALCFLCFLPYTAPLIVLGIFSLLSLASSVICFDPLMRRIAKS